MRVEGARRSEEPYSGEDIRLLAAVSLQSALTVQTICLSEEMAARIEAERRAEQPAEGVSDDSVQRFAGVVQSDDLTLLVARATASRAVTETPA